MDYITYDAPRKLEIADPGAYLAIRMALKVELGRTLPAATRWRSDVLRELAKGQYRALRQIDPSLGPASIAHGIRPAYRHWGDDHA